MHVDVQQDLEVAGPGNSGRVQDRLGVSRCDGSGRLWDHRPMGDLKRFGGHWRRDGWAGLVPNGIGQQKPNHYGDMLKVVAENRGDLRYAWKVLNKGVCDGCALGVAGLHDWTIEGVHLCMTRLKLLRVNTAPAFDPGLLADVEPLRERSSTELRELGRLGHPMRRRRGDRGFRRITWDEAMALDRRRDPGDRTRAGRDVPDVAGDHERVVLRGRQGGAGDGRRLGRLGRPGLPRALDARPQGHHRGGGVDLLPRRRHRERPDRPLGLEPGEQPAGVHQVPLPGQGAGREGRGRQPVPRARAGEVLGAVLGRVGGVRHEALRPARAGASRRATSRSPTRWSSA